ncbi:MAG: type II toxin-antitoxin system RelE/ParE family toxin [Candidatus Sedimenticola sp. (ex Thyasira tokunagai)]
MDSLADARAKTRIQISVDKLSLGLESDWKPISNSGGIRELRIREGKGYRVYYAWDGKAVVILLCCGDKPSQKKDVKKAKEYWKDINS